LEFGFWNWYRNAILSPDKIGTNGSLIAYILLTLLPNMGKIIPEMGKYINDYSLANGLFTKTRQAVIAFLYEQAETSFYTSQVLNAVKIGRGTVQRELKNLTDAGIIIREVRGRQVYYSANDKCPIFDELKSIVGKILAVAPALSAEEGSGDEVVARRFRVPKERLADYCRRHHIKKLSLFGSVLRRDFQPDSDIDVLVEFEPGHVPGFAIIDIEAELSQLVGRKVDLRTANDLSRYFRDRVVREAKVLYVAD